VDFGLVEGTDTELDGFVSLTKAARVELKISNPRRQVAEGVH
jgi:hypothetical protein